MDNKYYTPKQKELYLGYIFYANSDEVYCSKKTFADAIDQMNDLRNSSNSQEQKRLASLAISQIQIAQMCAVKALTWKD